MNNEDSRIIPCYGRYAGRGKCVSCQFRRPCRDAKAADDASAVKDRAELEVEDFCEELTVCPEVVETPSGRVLDGWKAVMYFIRMFCGLHAVTQIAINQLLKSCNYSRRKFLQKTGITEDSFGHAIRQAPACVRKFLHYGPSADNRKLPITPDDYVYISGPMTGIEDYNFPAFNAAEQYLMETYHPRHVINPAINVEAIGHERDHALYMALAIAEVKAATCIYLLPGWQDSKGARQEVACAKKHHIPIYEEN